MIKRTIHMQTHKRTEILDIVGILVMMVAIGFLAWKNAKDFEEGTIANTQQLLSNIAKAKSESIEAFVSNIQDHISIVADNPVVQDTAAGNKSYEDVIGTDGYFIMEDIYKHLEGTIHRLYRLDSKGIIQSRIPWDSTMLGNDYSGKPGIKIVMESHKPYVSDLFLSSSGKRCFSVCCPIFREKQFVGIIRAAIDLSTIQEMAKQFKVGKKGYVQIIDDDGYLLAHPADEHIGKDIMITRKEVFSDYDWSELQEVVREMKSGKTGVATYHSAWWKDENPEIIRKLTAFAPIRIGNELWSLGAVMSYDEISAPVKAHSRETTAGSLLVLLVFFMVGRWFYKVHKEKEKLIIKVKSSEKLYEANCKLNIEVTDRKQAENACEAANQQLKATNQQFMASQKEIEALSKLPFENPNPVLRIAKDGKILYSNKAAELLLSKWESGVGKAVPEKWCNLITEAFASEKNMEEEEEVKDRIFSITITPVKDAEYVNLYSCDITDHKLAEKNLKRNETRYHSIIQNSLEGFWIVDLKGQFIDINDSYCKMIGYTREELLKMSIFDVESVETSEETSQRIKKIKTTAYSRFETHHRCKDGKVINVENNLTYLDENEGRFVVFIKDITEEKHTEKVLRESEQRYHRITEAVTDYIYTVRLENSHPIETIHNIASLAVTGYSSEEFNANPYLWLDMIYHEDRQIVCEQASQCILGKDITPLEHRIIHKHNSIRWVRSTLVPHLDHQGKLLSYDGLLQDITKRKQAEENLKQAKVEADAGNKTKSQFLANMSHEIRTPMNAILGFGEILAEESPTETQKQYIKIIRNSSNHLLMVIDDILDFSKIEAGKLDIELRECSIIDMLNTVESMIHSLAKEKGLKFEIDTTPDLPANIITDSGRLQQCLINTLNNAVKFTKEGHVHLNIALQERDNQTYIRFDVEDTGMGIPSEMQEKVFNSFTQADESHTRKYGGTGLGLAITKRLTELLGGELTLTSQEGTGSVFTIVIPVGLDVTDQPRLDRCCVIGKKDSSEENAERVELSGHVLVVEDVKTNQILIETLLNNMGIDVTVVEDGNQVLQEVLTHQFDLILMDIQMPHMNGYEATKALRKEGITTPIIALTANAMKGDDKKCIESGCDGYIAKPINQTQLVEAIGKYLPVKAKV